MIEETNGDEQTFRQTKNGLLLFFFTTHNLNPESNERPYSVLDTFSLNTLFTFVSTKPNASLNDGHIKALEGAHRDYS